MTLFVLFASNNESLSFFKRIELNRCLSESFQQRDKPITGIRILRRGAFLCRFQNRLSRRTVDVQDSNST